MCQVQPHMLKPFAKEVKVIDVTFSRVSWVYAHLPEVYHDGSQGLSVPDPGLAWALTSCTDCRGFTLCHEKETDQFPNDNYNNCVLIQKLLRRCPLIWDQGSPVSTEKATSGS